MKIYKIRMNCICFDDVVVKASNKKIARRLAESWAQCPQDDMEFGEFLELNEGDKVDCEE